MQPAMQPAADFGETEDRIMERSEEVPRICPFWADYVKLQREDGEFNGALRKFFSDCTLELGDEDHERASVLCLIAVETLASCGKLKMAAPLFVEADDFFCSYISWAGNVAEIKVMVLRKYIEIRLIYPDSNSPKEDQTWWIRRGNSPEDVQQAAAKIIELYPDIVCSPSSQHSRVSPRAGQVTKSEKKEHPILTIAASKEDFLFCLCMTACFLAFLLAFVMGMTYELSAKSCKA